MKRIASLVLMIVLVLGGLNIAVNADDIKQYEGFEYTEEGDMITITGYPTGRIKSQIVSQTTVNIPSEINGKPIVKIGDRAFSNCMFVPKIVIPKSVIRIGNSAFAYCSSLSSLTIPDSVISIGDRAFAGCDGLSSIKIPSSVMSIGTGAFTGHYLYEIQVDRTNPNYSSIGGVLFNKNKTTMIKCPDNKKGAYAIPSNVINIESHAFSKCMELTSVIIPNSVTDIAADAFYGCYKSQLALYVYPNSHALTFAEQNGFKFVVIVQTDLETLPWATPYILDVIGKGLMSGSVDESGSLSFNPAVTTTRAEFATALYNYLGLQRDNSKIFSDTTDHWARWMISALVSKGVLTGYSDTVFAPDDPITREQIATILNRALKPIVTTTDYLYIDHATISDWAQDSVYTVYSVGWMKGDEAGTFRPQDTATRAEVAVIFSKLAREME